MKLRTGPLPKRLGFEQKCIPIQEMHDTIYLNPSIVAPPYIFLSGKSEDKKRTSMMLANSRAEELKWKGERDDEDGLP